MLNDNQKIDYRNGFSFSFLCLYYRFSKWVRVHWWHQITERLLASLLIKLKSSVDTLRSAVLRCVRWPGRRLACPVGLLHIVCCTGQRAPPTPYRPRVTALSKRGRCSDVHARRFIYAVWLVFSCNWWNRKRLNSLTSIGWDLSLIHIWRCRRIERCRSRWSPYH